MNEEVVIFSGTVRPTVTPETFLQSSITIYLSGTPGLSDNPDLLNLYHIKKNTSLLLSIVVQLLYVSSIYMKGNTQGLFGSDPLEDNIQFTHHV